MFLLLLLFFGFFFWPSNLQPFSFIDKSSVPSVFQDNHLILPPSCASLLSSLPLRFLLHAFFKNLGEELSLYTLVLNRSKSGACRTCQELSEKVEVLTSALSHAVKSNHHSMCKWLEHDKKPVFGTESPHFVKCIDLFAF